MGGILGNCRGGEGFLGGGDGFLGGGDGFLGGGDGFFRGGEGGFGGVEKIGFEGFGFVKLRFGLGGFSRGIWIGFFFFIGFFCCC